MPSHVQAQGIKVIDEQHHAILPELYKGWNDNVFTVFEESIASLPSAKSMGGDMQNMLSKEEYEKMLQEAVQETVNGAAINFQKLIVLIAQKNE